MWGGSLGSVSCPKTLDPKSEALQVDVFGWSALSYACEAGPRFSSFRCAPPRYYAALHSRKTSFGGLGREKGAQPCIGIMMKGGCNRPRPLGLGVVVEWYGRRCRSRGSAAKFLGETWHFAKLAGSVAIKG